MAACVRRIEITPDVFQKVVFSPVIRGCLTGMANHVDYAIGDSQAQVIATGGADRAAKPLALEHVCNFTLPFSQRHSLAPFASG